MSPAETLGDEDCFKVQIIFAGQSCGFFGNTVPLKPDRLMVYLFPVSSRCQRSHLSILLKPEDSVLLFSGLHVQHTSPSHIAGDSPAAIQSNRLEWQGNSLHLYLERVPLSSREHFVLGSEEGLNVFGGTKATAFETL